MTIPNKGWLPSPISGAVTQYTLPVIFQVYYYVCNPGPYDPKQPYELPLIRAISINQIPFADSGYKRGAWGWVAGIQWAYAYGDALIDWVYPPLDPTSLDDPCPNNVAESDDAETAITIRSVETLGITAVSNEDCPAPTIVAPDNNSAPALTSDQPQTITIVEDTWR